MPSPPPPSAAAAYVYLWNMHTMSFVCERSARTNRGWPRLHSEMHMLATGGLAPCLTFFFVCCSCVRVCTREHARMSRDEITSCVCACACVIAIASNKRRLPPYNILAAQY